MKVFDWEKAAQLIKKYNPMYAFEGIEDIDADWGCIYMNGRVINQPAKLFSNEESPCIMLCYVTEEIPDAKLYRETTIDNSGVKYRDYIMECYFEWGKEDGIISDFWTHEIVKKYGLIKYEFDDVFDTEKDTARLREASFAPLKYDPKFPVVSNVTLEKQLEKEKKQEFELPSGDERKEKLLERIRNGLKWVDYVNEMRNKNV